jgi:hypothetical protein
MNQLVSIAFILDREPWTGRPSHTFRDPRPRIFWIDVSSFPLPQNEPDDDISDWDKVEKRQYSRQLPRPPSCFHIFDCSLNISLASYRPSGDLHDYGNSSVGFSTAFLTVEDFRLLQEALSADISRLFGSLEVDYMCPPEVLSDPRHDSTD